MPQSVTNIERAKFIESTILMLGETHKRGLSTGLPDGFHYSNKNWIQQDLIDFAKSRNTFDYFETLLDITNTAVRTHKNGHFTKEALDAQAALSYLKPISCHTWMAFYSMISNAADASQAIRNIYHKQYGLESQKTEHPYGSAIKLPNDIKYCGDFSVSESSQPQSLGNITDSKTGVFRS